MGLSWAGRCGGRRRRWLGGGSNRLRRCRSCAAADWRGRIRVSRIDVAELDVREGSADGRSRGVDSAGASAIGRSPVKPRHPVGRRVIPQADRQHHPCGKRLGQRHHFTGALPSGRASRFAERSVDRVPARGAGNGVLDDHAVLDVDAVDLDEIAGRQAVVGDELGDHGERLGGVDGLSRAVEALRALCVRIVTAAVAVALAVATRARASVRPVLKAAMGGESVGNGVGLPDVHLIATLAGAVEVGLCTEKVVQNRVERSLI